MERRARLWVEDRSGGGAAVDRKVGEEGEREARPESDQGRE